MVDSPPPVATGEVARLHVGGGALSNQAPLTRCEVLLRKQYAFVRRKGVFYV